MAIDMYEKVAKNIAPKRESLHKAEVDHHESLEQLTRKKQQLREAQEKLKSVHDDMQVNFRLLIYFQILISLSLRIQINILDSRFNVFSVLKTCSKRSRKKLSLKTK